MWSTSSCGRSFALGNSDKEDRMNPARGAFPTWRGDPLTRGPTGRPAGPSSPDPRPCGRGSPRSGGWERPGPACWPGPSRRVTGSRGFRERDQLVPARQARSGSRRPPPDGSTGRRPMKLAGLVVQGRCFGHPDDDVPGLLGRARPVQDAVLKDPGLERVVLGVLGGCGWIRDMEMEGGNKSGRGAPLASRFNRYTFYA